MSLLKGRLICLRVVIPSMDVVGSPPSGMLRENPSGSPK
jgi:hypothetical protein